MKVWTTTLCLCTLLMRTAASCQTWYQGEHQPGNLHARLPRRTQSHRKGAVASRATVREAEAPRHIGPHRARCQADALLRQSSVGQGLGRQRAAARCVLRSQTRLGLLS
jgi:hypothetical protein